MKGRFVFALVALCASPLVATPPEPAVSFSTEGPVASGMTAGGQLILLGVSKEYDDGVRRLVRSEAALTDSDQDGSVELDLGKEVSPQSVWIAVDLESGGYAVDGPDEAILTTLPLTGEEVQSSSNEADELVIEGRWSLHVLLVRPEVGAWLASVTDGGVDDADGVGDGVVHFPLDRLEPLDGSPALNPPNVASGDVLLAVAPESLETIVGRISLNP